MKFRDEYYFLSNTYPCDIIVNGIKYKSSESAYQSFKMLNSKFRYIFSSLNGFESKELSKSIKLRDDWDDIKLQIMDHLLRIKFKDPKLMGMLRKVDVEIVEDNTWYDIFWGRCNGEGRNELGKILMNIRDGKERI